jgi:hypothetical protein
VLHVMETGLLVPYASVQQCGGKPVLEAMYKEKHGLADTILSIHI